MSLRDTFGRTFPRPTKTHVYSEYEELLEKSKQHLRQVVHNRTSPFALVDLTPGKDWRGITELQLIHEVVTRRYPELDEAKVQKRVASLAGILLKNVLIEHDREFVKQPEKRPGTGANIYRMVG